MTWTVTALYRFYLFLHGVQFLPHLYFVKRLHSINEVNKTLLHCAIGPGESVAPVEVSVGSIAGRHCLLLQCAAGRNVEEADSGKVVAKFRAGSCECGAWCTTWLLCTIRFTTGSLFYVSSLCRFLSARVWCWRTTQPTASGRKWQIFQGKVWSVPCVVNSAAYESVRYTLFSRTSFSLRICALPYPLAAGASTPIQENGYVQSSCSLRRTLGCPAVWNWYLTFAVWTAREQETFHGCRVGRAGRGVARSHGRELDSAYK